jgi:hypothetical protein
MRERKRGEGERERASERERERERKGIEENVFFENSLPPSPSDSFAYAELTESERQVRELEMVIASLRGELSDAKIQCEKLNVEKQGNSISNLIQSLMPSLRKGRGGMRRRGCNLLLTHTTHSRTLIH